MQFSPHAVSTSFMTTYAPQDIEWGTIDVYTCSRNCCKETYCEEAIIMQDIPIEELQIPQLNKKPSSSKA